MVEAPRNTAIRILMLEDSALDAELIVAQLKRAHLAFSTDRVWTREDFLRAIESGGYDVILADHVLPGFDGDTALTLAREHAPEIPFIFVSGTLTEELAVQALTRGARDYVVKQRLQRLPEAVLRALSEREERARLARAEAELQQSRDRLQLITDSLPALITHLGTDHDFRFVNHASHTSRKYLPETMGGGVAMLDFNGDGLPDLFFVNGAELKDPMPPGGASGRAVRIAIMRRASPGSRASGRRRRRSAAPAPARRIRGSAPGSPRRSRCAVSRPALRQRSRGVGRRCG